MDASPFFIYIVDCEERVMRKMVAVLSCGMLGGPLVNVVRVFFTKMCIRILYNINDAYTSSIYDLIIIIIIRVIIIIILCL